MNNIDFAEVHRQADLLAKKRLKSKKYYKEVLDAVVLKAAHGLAYWDIINELDKVPEMPPTFWKRIKDSFKYRPLNLQ